MAIGQRQLLNRQKKIFSKGEYGMVKNRPNIIFINTDQQSASALSCAGNPYIHTPNLDRLAAKGIRFERAYAANPVCIPSRFSMFSGRYPSEIGMEGNDHHKNHVSQDILDTAMGNILVKAGYEAVYGGKIHLPGPAPVYEKVEPYGFTMRTDNYRELLADDCIDFLRQPHEKPFIMVASFVNPHDICYYAYNEYNLLKGKRIVGHRGTLEWDACVSYRKELEQYTEDELERIIPPLPDNYEIPENELTCFQLDKPDFMCWSRTTWGEKEWRLLRYLYKKFVERVDAKIGRVLDAVEKSGLKDNTLILFTSDHGDMGASHRSDEKGYLYEECSRVPFILTWKDRIQPGQVDTEHLVSSGIDLIPTMCEAAGIEIPPELEGKSLLSLTMSGSAGWRNHLLIENNLSRCIHFGDWKYMVGTNKPYPKGEKCNGCEWDCFSKPYVREQVTNIKTDPGEMRNWVGEPQAQETVRLGRKIIRDRYEKYKREIDSGYIVE